MRVAAALSASRRPAVPPVRQCHGPGQASRALQARQGGGRRRRGGEDQAADLLKATVVASIGPVTAEAAQQLGLHTTVMPARYTIPDLVDALVEHFSLPVRTS